MIEVKTSFNTEPLDRLAIAFKTTPDIIQEVVNADVKPVVVDYVENTLSVYPGPIKPGSFRRHATKKQLRFVMAKIRRGEWTGRTGALKEAWQTVVEAIALGSTIQVRNVSRVAKYVVGDRQQAFHAETGWPFARTRAIELRRVVFLSVSKHFIRRFVDGLKR